MLFKSGFNSGALFFAPAVCAFCQFYLKQYTYEDGQCPRLLFPIISIISEAIISDLQFSEKSLYTSITLCYYI